MNLINTEQKRKPFSVIICFNSLSDTDECKNRSICSGKSNSRCVNMIGNFSCECKDGFIEDSNNCIGG